MKPGQFVVIRSDRTAHDALALGFAGQVGLGRARAAGLFGPCRLKQALYILFVLKDFYHFIALL